LAARGPMDNQLQMLVEQVRSGGSTATRAAARLMSAATDEPARLASLLGRSHDWPQPRLVLGVTGAPGSGKSTLVDRLAAEFRRRWPSRRVGIVGVDPSSPFTGGALLGDRVRMMRHATDPGVFIRSLATRGRLGGLALGAKGVVRVMGLWGCDIVIVETVGVGQSEVEIAQNADVTTVVLAPGQGDSIQMLKAGLMEAGDLFVVNKADREGAARLHQQLLSALDLKGRGCVDGAHHLASPKDLEEVVRRSRGPLGGSAPEVFLCSAVNHSGIDDFVNFLETLAGRHAVRWQAARQAQAVSEVRQALLREVERRVGALLDEMSTDRVLSGKQSISAAVEGVLSSAAERSGQAVCEGSIT
jgi:LAO/AO transport system ATPase